jgi:hypothetical protein
MSNPKPKPKSKSKSKSKSKESDSCPDPDPDLDPGLDPNLDPARVAAIFPESSIYSWTHVQLVDFLSLDDAKKQAVYDGRDKGEKGHTSVGALTLDVSAELKSQLARYDEMETERDENCTCEYHLDFYCSRRYGESLAAGGGT